MARSVTLVLMVLVFCPPVECRAGAAVFRAGAFAADITPPFPISMNGGMQDRTATHAHDRLHARCLVLDDGHTKVAFVVCDSCMIPRSITDGAKRLIEETTGIKPAAVLISATHTHTAPTLGDVFQSDTDQRYAAMLPRLIADGVARAVRQLEPAQIGWGVVEVPGQVFNRRWRMKPGTVLADPFGQTTDKVKMNPPAGSGELVEPAGPIDPAVSFLALRAKSDGKPLALLANYSLHYVGDVPPQAVSADYFGAFAERIGELIADRNRQPPFVGIMSNGTSGDINNINFRTPHAPLPTFGRIRLVADDVARAVHGAYKNVEFRDWVSLDARQRELELGVRLPTESDLARARGVLAKAKKPVLQTLEEVYARETVKLAETFPPKVTLVLQAIRVGDVGIAAIPCEVFVEIGLEIKRTSPLQPAFTIELANGYNGYLPTPEHHALGGYETWRARSSYLEVGASPKIVRVISELMAEVAKGR